MATQYSGAKYERITRGKFGQDKRDMTKKKKEREDERKKIVENGENGIKE